METPRIENRPAWTLAGLQQHYTDETRTDIPGLWNQFGPRIGSIPATVDKVAYGVIWSTPDGDGFDYLAAVEVSETAALPDDFTVRTLPAQKYAVFAHAGHIATLCQTIDRAFHQWLPQSGHEPSGNPDFFEWYGEAFNPETGTGGMEIWVPIQG